MKAPGDYRPQTPDDEAYVKALRGDQHRFGLRIPVLTNEDWGGSYHRGPDRFMPDDEYGEVMGEYLDVHAVADPEHDRFWVSVWGTDTVSMIKRCTCASEVEAVMRRMPIIVDRLTLMGLGFGWD